MEENGKGGTQYPQGNRPAEPVISTLDQMIEENLVITVKVENLRTAIMVKQQLIAKAEDLDKQMRQILFDSWEDITNLAWEAPEMEEAMPYIMQTYLNEGVDLQVLNIEQLPNYLEEFFDMRPPKTSMQEKLYRDFWEKVDSELIVYAEAERESGWQVIKQMDDAALELLNLVEPVFEQFYMGKDSLIFRLRKSCSEDAMM